MINKKSVIAMLLVSAAIVCVVLATGCVSTPKTVVTPTPTPAVTPVQAFNETHNGTNVTAPINSTFTVSLAENPSTGYSWNVTVSEGLTIVNETYLANSTLIGAGGIKTWTVSAVSTGEQEFCGLYSRPWDQITNATASVDNSTVYGLFVKVV